MDDGHCKTRRPKEQEQTMMVPDRDAEGHDDVNYWGDRGEGLTNIVVVVIGGGAWELGG